MGSRFNKVINLLFLIAFFSIIIALFSYIFIFKEQQNVSFIENRNLYTKDLLLDDKGLNESFQSKLDHVFEDQFFKRYEIVNGKRKVNYYLSGLLYNKSTLESKLEPLNDPNLFRVGTTQYIVNKPMVYEERIEERVKRRLDQYAELQATFPDVNVVVYHPRQAHETSLFDIENELDTYGEELKELMKSYSKIPYLSLDMEDLDSYKKHFYSSDHHWNHLGSYVGYRDILSLLDSSIVPLEPKNLDCNYSFYGSFATRTGGILNPSEFCIFEFDTIPYSITNSDKKNRETSLYEDFYNQKDELDAWSYLYSVAYPYEGYLSKIESKVNDKVLMLVGDSYMPPVIGLLAQHFGTVYAVNPVNHYIKFWKPFDFYSFIEENSVNSVAFMLTIENYFYEDEYGPRYKFNDVVKEVE